MSGRNGRSLLTEILFAVLFFALSCCVLLGIFSAVHSKSKTADASEKALVIMKNIAEELSAAEDEEKLLEEKGFYLKNGVYCLEIGNIKLNVTISREYTPFGFLRAATVSAFHKDSVLGTLTADRYFPKEAGS